MVPESVGPNIMLDQDGSGANKVKVKQKEKKIEEWFPSIYHVVTKRD